MRGIPNDNPTRFGLLCAGLGALLLLSPAILGAHALPEAGRNLPGLWSAAFAGTLLVRLGLSAALRFRPWKARAMIAVGAWLVGAPWLPPFGQPTGPTLLHAALGLAVLVLGVASLRPRAGGGWPWQRRTEPC